MRMTCLSFLVMIVTGDFLGDVARTTPTCFLGIELNSLTAVAFVTWSIGIRMRLRIGIRQ